MSKVSTFNARSNFPHLTIDAHLLTALTSSPKDRLFILQTESRILCLVRRPTNANEPALHFQDLNSYYRMLVHRVVRFYGLERTADSVGRSVTVYRPQSAYLRPLVKLSDLVEPESAVPPDPKEGVVLSSTRTKFVIMKRAAETGPAVSEARTETPSKTLEEREKEYEQARARIFAAFKEAESAVTSYLADEDSIQVRAHPPQAMESREDNGEDVVHFGGWKNIDSIQPFIPTVLQNHSPKKDVCILPSEEHDPYDIDFENIWIPQHIFVALNLPVMDPSALRSFKSRCKRQHCKVYVMDGSDVGLLLFVYRVGETEEWISNKLGVVVERWRPLYFPEPPQ